MSFSRRHYRLVSPPADKPQDIADRRARYAASDHAVADRKARYPQLTAANASEAIAYQEDRYRTHYAALTAESVPTR